MKKLGFQISKQEILDVISCKPFAVENLLKKVYKAIQKYTGDKSNLSGENYNENASGHETSAGPNNYNKPSHYSGNSNTNESPYRKIIEEKDLKIEELKNIIDVRI